MSDTSAIEWTDATWNVVTGCTKLSPGCAKCYIDRTPPFRIAGRRFVNGTTGLEFHEDRLELPFSWRKPRRVFVNSLSDLFHEDVPPALVGEMFRVMRDTPQHTYQILTKRPERMVEVLGMVPLLFALPLPNVWLGVSIENARYTWRARVLAEEVPAFTRFISAEPLLGSLFEDDGVRYLSHGKRGKEPLDLTGIDWVIVGGESGPGARPMKLRWALEVVEAAQAAGVAVFVKQLGKVQGKVFGGQKGEVFETWPEPLRVREYPESGPEIIREIIQESLAGG